MLITISEAAKYCNVTETVIKNRLEESILTGQNGQIHFESLPVSAKINYCTNYHHESGFDFAALSQDDKDLVLQRLEIVNQMDQIPPNMSKTSWITQLAEKSNQGVATLYRWQRLWKDEKSMSAFLRKKRTDSGTAKSFSPDAQEWLIMDYLQHLNKLQAYQNTKPEALARGWAFGDYSSACRILKTKVDQDAALYQYAKNGNRGLDNNIVASILRDPSSLQPMQIVCGDHHQFDLFVVVPQLNGKILRPWITAWQDVRCRAIVGWNINLQPNSWTIALATRHMIMPKSDPRNLFYGVPGIVYIDNGKDYRSWHLAGDNWKLMRLGKIDYNQDTQGVFNELGIKQLYALPYNAKAKPIERFFNTIEHQLIETLPGFCGHTNDNKPGAQLRQQINRMELLSLDDFINIINEYIVNSYHNNDHRGRGMDNSSPITVWNQYVNNGFKPVLTNGETVLNALLIKEKRPKKVERHGVRFNNEFYYNDILIFHIGQHLQLRYDPTDLSRVWLYNQNGFLTTADRFNYAGYLDNDEQIGSRIAQQRHQKKQIREKYIKLSGGIDRADNTKGDSFSLKNNPYEQEANENNKKQWQQDSENFSDIYPFLPPIEN